MVDSRFQKYAKSNITESDDQLLERLSRHIILDGWGLSEQKILDGLRIVVIGVGGLGSALGLIISGSLHRNHSLVFVDGDTVEISNLHRQIAFMEDMVGVNKAECMEAVCKRRNSTLNVSCIPQYFNRGDASDIVRDADVVFDCTDNVKSRIEISNAWISTGRKALLISASCVGWSGQVIRLCPGQSGCMSCVYNDIGTTSSACDHIGQCAVGGVMAPVVSTIANYQFLQLLRWIREGRNAPMRTTGTEQSVVVDVYDFSGSTQFARTLHLAPVCSKCSGNDSSKTQEPDDGATPGTTGKEISADEFLHLLHSNQCNVIDVRERTHYELSRLDESCSLPAGLYLHYASSQLPTDIENMIRTESRSTVVVCRRGIDSLRFVKKYRGNCVSLKGGLLGLGIRGIV